MVRSAGERGGTTGSVLSRQVSQGREGALQEDREEWWREWTGGARWYEKDHGTRDDGGYIYRDRTWWILPLFQTPPQSTQRW